MLDQKVLRSSIESAAEKIVKRTDDMTSAFGRLVCAPSVSFNFALAHELLLSQQAHPQDDSGLNVYEFTRIQTIGELR